tara:strand:+ start:79 stop:309 length:231 start_codon:yes stop_codon:yes gene_type:complete
LFSIPSKSKNIDKNLINKKIISLIEKDGRVFLAGTIINKENVLRINCTNHRRRKEDIDFLFTVLKEIGKKAESLLS